MTQPAEVVIIPLPFVCNEGMDCVMIVIAPLGVDAESSQLLRFYNPYIIEIALGNEVESSATKRGKCIDLFSKFLQEGRRARIDNAVHRIDPESIDMIITKQVQRALDKKKTYLITEGVVEVHRIAPGCFIF